MILSSDFERSNIYVRKVNCHIELLPIVKNEEYGLDYDTKRGIRGILGSSSDKIK
jgi:hypothetical protein